MIVISNIGILMIKPRIQLIDKNFWRCAWSDDFAVYCGFGYTPKEAYAYWVTNMSIRGINIYARTS